jgi:hypothetical protein
MFRPGMWCAGPAGVWVLWGSWTAGVPHGTTHGYRYCPRPKCPPCFEAGRRGRAHRLDLVRRRGYLTSHGLSGYRNYRCRCRRCGQASSLYDASRSR